MPDEQEHELTKRCTISSDDWHALDDKPAAEQAAALAELIGRAAGYAGLLMLPPERFNWAPTGLCV